MTRLRCRKRHFVGAVPHGTSLTTTPRRDTSVSRPAWPDGYALSTPPRARRSCCRRPRGRLDAPQRRSRRRPRTRSSPPRRPVLPRSPRDLHTVRGRRARSDERNRRSWRRESVCPSSGPQRDRGMDAEFLDPLRPGGITRHDEPYPDPLRPLDRVGVVVLPRTPPGTGAAPVPHLEAELRRGVSSRSAHSRARNAPSRCIASPAMPSPGSASTDHRARPQRSRPLSGSTRPSAGTSPANALRTSSSLTAGAPSSGTARARRHPRSAARDPRGRPPTMPPATPGRSHAG